MKKTAILLSLILSAFIISSCAEKNPNDPNTDNSTKITLAQRVGTYSGDMSGLPLDIIFNDKGEVTSVDVNKSPLPAKYDIKVGDPSSTATDYSFDVEMADGSSVVKVRVIFDSDTEATGGKAYIGLTGEIDMSNPIIIKKVS